MIQDEELRDLFKVECEEHLQRLNDGFLRLEKKPEDMETLENIFREAHSIKGAARMVGESDIEMLAHRLEDILGKAKKRELLLTSEIIDRMLHGLDAIGKCVNQAVTGEPSGIKFADVLAELKGGIHESRPESPETLPEEEKDAAPEKKEGEEAGNLEKPSETVHLPGAAPPFRIETVRVETKMLDMLMTHAGELTVTRSHIARRLAEMEEAMEFWEELKKKEEKARFSPEGKAGKLPEVYGWKRELLEKMDSLLNRTMNGLYEDNTRIDFIADRLDEGIRGIRLVPFSTLFNFFPRMVRDMAKAEDKEIELVIEGADTAADKRIIEEMKDPLTHMIRNAIGHGIEKPAERESAGKPAKGTLRLQAYQTASNIVIEVSDDGKGLDTEGIRMAVLKQRVRSEKELEAMTPAQLRSLIFLSGLSTSGFVTDVSGRGVGLDVVRENVERLKGTVTVESSPGKGTTFGIKLPVTLATLRVVIAEAGGRSYSIPAEAIETSRLVSPLEIFSMAGRKTITLDRRPLSVTALLELLELKEESGTGESRDKAMPCVILSIENERIGLLVDNLLEEQEIVLKPQSALLKHVRNVSGAAILATGEVCMVLNPRELIRSLQKREAPPPEKPHEEERKKIILLAEDSIITRTQEKRILEGDGYEVLTAVDGLDAFNKLNSRPFDAVVSDILMPNMDGLTLTEKIRQDKKYKELPVILVTTLASDEDKRRGMEVGANAYIPKPSFNQRELLEILRRLV